MEYLISIVLVGFSALFSGLTLGLMGLDVHALKRKIQLGNKQAKKVYAVRKRGNLLLTTLLLGNVAVNAILAIFLGSIASGVMAGVISTALIFLLGEIIPQAIISRHALVFGAKTAWIVRILLVVFLPITAPIAWILDKALGDEMPTIITKQEMMKVFEEHEKATDSEIDEDEERILKGALTFSNREVRQVMTPETVVAHVDSGEKLTQKFLRELRDTGHSRFPVFADGEEDVVGILHLRNTVGRPLKGKTVKSVMDKTFKVIASQTKLDTALNEMLTARQQLFIVENEFGGFEGVITIEDILEEIVGREIVDESDKHVDMRAYARKQAKKR